MSGSAKFKDYRSAGSSETKKKMPHYACWQYTASSTRWKIFEEKINIILWSETPLSKKINPWQLTPTTSSMQRTHECYPSISSIFCFKSRVFFFLSFFFKFDLWSFELGRIIQREPHWQVSKVECQICHQFTLTFRTDSNQTGMQWNKIIKEN